MKWNAFQFLRREPSGIDRAGTVISGPQKAFTLAEVLITLAIIGIVAALTIPTVVRNYQEKQAIVRFKKAYSQLNSAFQMAVVENGDPTTWNWSDTDNVMNTYFIPYLKILKNCKTGKGCWSDTVKNLNGNAFVNFDSDARAKCSKLMLADGTSFRIWNFLSGCRGNQSLNNVKPLNKSCAELWIDTNGKKEPNTLGYDVFYFYVTKYGIYPVGAKDDKIYGAISTYCNKNQTDSNSGRSCSYWVLQHNNRDYLKPNFVCTTDTDCHLE